MSEGPHPQTSNGGYRCSLCLWGTSHCCVHLEEHEVRYRESLERIYAATTKLWKEVHGDNFELKQPRISGRQTHRNNLQADTPEQYYRITFFNEFLSHTIAELDERFINHPSPIIGLLHLLPRKCCSSDIEPESPLPEELVNAAEFYKEDLPLSVMLPTEYRLWIRKWRQHGPEAPKKLVDALHSCDVTAFPNIRVLLQLALTVPITSCESERSFSQLKLLKTSHRSTMSPTRLSGLALMKMNKTQCNSFQQSPAEMKKLVELFYQLHPRRMKLSFILSD